MNGESPEAELARLRYESRKLADALEDTREIVTRMGEAGNTHVQLWGRRLMDGLRPILDLVRVVRSRR